MACFTLLRRIECRWSLHQSLAFLCNAPSTRSLAYENLGGAGPAGKFQICKVHYNMYVYITWKWCWTWNESEWVKYRKAFKRSEVRKSSQKRRKWNEMNGIEWWFSMIDRPKEVEEPWSSISGNSWLPWFHSREGRDGPYGRTQTLRTYGKTRWIAELHWKAGGDVQTDLCFQRKNEMRK